MLTIGPPRPGGPLAQGRRRRAAGASSADASRPKQLLQAYQREINGDRAQAARRWTDLGCRYEAGLALAGATEERGLREALRIFTDLGASATARITQQKIRTLGVRSIPAGPRTATRTHPLGLTRREREVLDLICGGHTNAEIAERLFISAKTVDHHVSAILAKLDAPTRGAAAAQAVRLGLAGVAEALPRTGTA